MFRYAQIDIVTGRCIGVSLLYGEVDADHMIPLTEGDNVNPNDTYDDGVWIPAPPPEPTPGESTSEKIAVLEAENADLKSRIADIEMFVADMIGGV